MWYTRRYGSLRRRRARQSPYQTPLETTTTTLGHGLRSLSADNGSAYGFLRHVSVEQWLREQENQNQHDTKPRNAQDDTHDIWYVLPRSGLVFGFHGCCCWPSWLGCPAGFCLRLAGLRAG